MKARRVSALGEPREVLSLNEVHVSQLDHGQPLARVFGGARTASVDVAVFDYGGVLTTPMSDSIAAWLDRDGIDPASFSRTLKAWLSRSAPDGTPIHRLETGELSTAEFDALLAAELVGKDGGTVAPEDLLSGLFAQMRPDLAMFDLVQDVKAAGVGVALLSNSWGNTYPRERIDAVFDLVVISGEVGMRKPEPEIFELALDRIGLPAGECVFVDDMAHNITAAERAGLAGIVHRTFDQTARELEPLFSGATWIHQRLH